MKPFRILIFFLALFAILAGISFLVPENGIRIADNITLRFYKLSSLFQKNTVSYADLSGFVNIAEISPDPELVPEKKITVLIDTTAELVFDAPPEINPAVDIDSVKKSVRKLELTERGRNLLYDFFFRMDMVRAGEIDRVRILHFGDSQIENDRMTSLIRFRLQNYFGGYGCGLVPAVPLYSGNPAYIEETSGEFLRYTVFGRKDTSLNHNSYGVLGCFTSLPDSKNRNLPALTFTFNSNRRAGRFDRIKLYLHSYADSSSITFQVNGSLSDTMRYINGGYNMISYGMDTTARSLAMGFNFLEGGRLYGISFESDRGVQIDNIAMRGSSGLIFTRMDGEVFEEMMIDLKVGLIILQFGGNVVPYIRDSDYYRRAFKRELAYLSRICPATPIIVIGPSDMSKKENGKFDTHPAVEPVRNALRAATLESGFVFWDLYEAMGGYNSMPAFVNADPALARPDYIHFSARGANLMAEMFYDALMLEYGKYKMTAAPQFTDSISSTYISKRSAWNNAILDSLPSGIPPSGLLIKSEVRDSITAMLIQQLAPSDVNARPTKESQPFNSPASLHLN